MSDDVDAPGKSIFHIRSNPDPKLFLINLINPLISYISLLTNQLNYCALVL